MQDQFSRTRILFGQEAMDRLKAARVAVFGVGGVGGYVVEALARSGIGQIDIIDNDQVSLTNLNRQIIATHETIGMDKVEVAKKRIHSINPNCLVRMHKTFFLPETEAEFDFKEYDYIVDAIDTVTGKIALVMNAQAAGRPIICSMGAGNKTDATAFEVTDLYQTSVCPLAKVMRRELKKRGIKHLKVVYSKEKPMTPMQDLTEAGADPEQTDAAAMMRRSLPGSTAWVPSVVGLIIGGEVVMDLLGDKAKRSEEKKAGEN